MMQRTQRTAIHELCNAYSASKGDLHGFFAEADKLPVHYLFSRAKPWSRRRCSELLLWRPDVQIVGTICVAGSFKALKGSGLLSLFNGREMRVFVVVARVCLLFVLSFCSAQKSSSLAWRNFVVRSHQASWNITDSEGQTSFFEFCRFGLGSPLAIYIKSTWIVSCTTDCTWTRKKQPASWINLIFVRSFPHCKSEVLIQGTKSWSLLVLLVDSILFAAQDFEMISIHTMVAFQLKHFLKRCTKKSADYFFPLVSLFLKHPFVVF